MYTIYNIGYRITNNDYVNMFNALYTVYLSDWLLVSAYICCLILVIGISAKSCIGAPLVRMYVYNYIGTYAWLLIASTSICTSQSTRESPLNHNLPHVTSLTHIA